MEAKWLSISMTGSTVVCFLCFIFFLRRTGMQACRWNVETKLYLRYCTKKKQRHNNRVIPSADSVLFSFHKQQHEIDRFPDKFVYIMPWVYILYNKQIMIWNEIWLTTRASSCIFHNKWIRQATHCRNISNKINHKTKQNFKNKIDQSLYYSIWYICATISGAQCSCNTWSSNDMIMAHDIHRKDNFTEKVVFIFEDIAFCIALFWPIAHELIDPDDVCVMLFFFLLDWWNES
jgi:hypothetical protein